MGDTHTAAQAAAQPNAQSATLLTGAAGLGQQAATGGTRASCQVCKDLCTDDGFNCLKCFTGNCFVHIACLIKSAREKSSKKFQGASPSWLYKLLHVAGLCYYCQKCVAVQLLATPININGLPRFKIVRRLCHWTYNQVSLVLKVK